MLSLDNSNERSPRLKSVGVDRSERDQSPKVRPSLPQLCSNNRALFRTETFSLATIFLIYSLRREKMEILILAVWVACAAVCYSQAKKKNLNVVLWTILGLLFGVFAVIGALVVSPKA